MSKDKNAVKTTFGAISAASKAIISADYPCWLSGLKDQISGARQWAVLSVNQEMVWLYRHIGADILERQTRQNWGAKVIVRLVADLRDAFPEMKGFSSSNLKYMRYFAQMCPISELVSGLLTNCQHSDRAGTFVGAGREG